MMCLKSKSKAFIQNPLLETSLHKFQYTDHLLRSDCYRRFCIIFSDRKNKGLMMQNCKIFEFVQTNIEQKASFLSNRYESCMKVYMIVQHPWVFLKWDKGHLLQTLLSAFRGVQYQSSTSLMSNFLYLLPEAA